MRHNSAIGRCDVLDMLEEAAVAHMPVELELRDGSRIVDGIRDVITENGEDYVVLQAHPRVAVSAIARCERSAHDKP